MKTETYYLCGGMSGIKDFNYPAFNRVAQRLRSGGCVIINPAENFGGRRDLPRSLYMRLDIGHVLQCRGVILMNGWECSMGGRLEAMIALELDLKFYDTEMKRIKNVIIRGMLSGRN